MLHTVKEHLVLVMMLSLKVKPQETVMTQQQTQMLHVEGGELPYLVPMGLTK